MYPCWYFSPWLTEGKSVQISGTEFPCRLCTSEVEHHGCMVFVLSLGEGSANYSLLLFFPYSIRQRPAPSIPSYRSVELPSDRRGGGKKKLGLIVCNFFRTVYCVCGSSSHGICDMSTAYTSCTVP